MFALGSIAAPRTTAIRLHKNASCSPAQLPAVRPVRLVAKAVSQEAPSTLEEAQTQVSKLAHDLQAANQQRDYWRMRCIEAEENLKKLKEKVGNTFAHGDAEGKHLPPKQAKPHAPVALAVDDDSHLGQKRFLPEDDNKGRRDM